MTLFYKPPSSSISILQLLIITILFHSNPVNAFAANRQPPALPLTPPQSSYRAHHHNYSPTTTTTSTSWNNSPTKQQRHSIRHSHTIHLSKLDNTNDDDDTAAADGATTTTTTTKVGSSEYYQGFLTRSVDEEPVERVTGDAVLGPTLKFAGGISLILVVLTAAFLVSNGIV